MSDGVSFVDNAMGVTGDLAKRAERALKRVAMVVETQAKGNCRNVLNTTGLARGDLMNAITHEIKGGGFDSVARVGPKIKYGAIHEFGGTITAKKAQYLKFELPDGSWAMVRSVRIPARPYLRPAVLEGRAAMAKAFADEMGK